MAYIFRVDQNYYVLKDLGDNLFDGHLRNDVFEVDELLAYPVAELCNKGYITEMCCSGHAFGSLYFEHIDNKRTPKKTENVILSCEYLSEYEANFMCCQGAPELGTFIKFKENIHFQSNPEGWVNEDHFLRFELQMQRNPSLYYKKLMDGILSLTEWIEQLPDVKEYYQT